VGVKRKEILEHEHLKECGTTQVHDSAYDESRRGFKIFPGGVAVASCAGGVSVFLGVIVRGLLKRSGGRTNFEPSVGLTGPRLWAYTAE